MDKLNLLAGWFADDAAKPKKKESEYEDAPDPKTGLYKKKEKSAAQKVSKGFNEKLNLASDE